MKKNIVFTLLFACLTLVQVTVFAQENNEAKTLFNTENKINVKNFGLFVAPSYSLTQMDGHSASLIGIRGGVSHKDKLSVGAYFNTSINQITPQSETIPNIYLDFWTVGGFAEYTLFSKKMVHLTIPVALGYGEVEMDNTVGELELGEASFFQIEPSALLEVNLHKNVRFNLGAGYRVVTDMNYRNFDHSDLSGLTGQIGLKFGLFR